MNFEIRKRLERIVCILQEDGESNPIANTEQVCHLVFLKIIDEEEGERELKTNESVQSKGFIAESLFIGQSKRYRWSNWRSRNGNELLEFVRNDVLLYMASLVREEPRIANYFRDAQLKIEDPGVFQKLVNEIDSISFAKLDIEVKSGIIEHLLTHFAQSEDIDLYRTPPQIRKLMVEMVSPDFGDTIYDPACGTGGFLIDAVEYILARSSTNSQEVPVFGRKMLDQREYSVEEVRKEIPNPQTHCGEKGDNITNWETLEQSIFGADISWSMVRIAMTNLMLHNIRHANIKRTDSVAEMEGFNNDVAGKFKVILSNPPIGRAAHSENSIFRRVPSRSGRVELLFLEGMISSLAPGGQCAVIVPESLLYGSTQAHYNLRRKLVDIYNVLAVVSLPFGVLVNNNPIKNSVLVLQRPTDHAKSAGMMEQNRRVWFYDVRTVGSEQKNTVLGNRQTPSDESDIPDLLVQWHKYKNSGFQEPTGIEGEAVLSGGSLEPRCWWATVKTIEENDYNLVANRYKPQIVESFSEDNPAELIKETLAIERDISLGLEQLLRKVADD